MPFANTLNKIAYEKKAGRRETHNGIRQSPKIPLVNGQWDKTGKANSALREVDSQIVRDLTDLLGLSKPIEFKSCILIEGIKIRNTVPVLCSG